jgi:hypothetical protein
MLPRKPVCRVSVTAWGVAAGDYDNDGFEDLFVTSYGRNTLYHHNGNGTFTDVTAQSSVAGSGWSSSAAWVDYDGDGLLDLIVLRYVTWDWDDYWCGEHREGFRAYCHPDIFPAIDPLVYHNDGNGHFTEVAQKVGMAKPPKPLGVAIADYDRDGRPDIMIANDSMPEFLYHNDGAGKFTEVGLISEVALDDNGKTFAGMGVDFGDYNNDGWPDLVITDLANQRYSLYKNNRDGSFVYSSGATGIGTMTVLHSGWGVRFLDFDNPYLRTAIEISSEDSKSHELLGKAYSRLDRLPEAREHMEKAVALTPEVASLHCTLAPVYRKLRLADKAEAEFARCSALTTQRPTTAPN